MIEWEGNSVWTEPKTDWSSDDYFNLKDYNRIKNNISYLRDLALEVYTNFPFEVMGSDKTSYTQYPYADEFNAMENNLELMRKNTFLFDNSVSKHWYENQKTPNYEDFNRLERACLLFYNGLNTQKSHKPFLPQTLGGFWRGADRHIGTLVFKDKLAKRLGTDNFIKC